MSQQTWREVGPGVYVRRHEELELNCGLVVGQGRALVIDTRGTTERGRELAAAVRQVTPLEQVVVNTHAHYDHCFGNAGFRDSQIYAHVGAADDLRSTAEHQREQIVAHLRATERPELAQQYVDTEVVLPFYLVESDTPIDLGDRSATLLYGGRGHTTHDLAIAVPDAGVVFWGDLIEQGADPAMDDAFPLEWADTLQTLLAHDDVALAEVAVPGHGDVVDAAYVQEQADVLGRLAETMAQGQREGIRGVEAMVELTRGIGLEQATLRDAAVRLLEVAR